MKQNDKRNKPNLISTVLQQVDFIHSQHIKNCTMNILPRIINNNLNNYFNSLNISLFKTHFHIAFLCIRSINIFGLHIPFPFRIYLDLSQEN